MDPQYGQALRATLARKQVPIPQPWNIYNFYAAPAKSDPWIPTGVIQTPAPNDQPAHQVHLTRPYVPQNNFLDYRSATGSPSDCATLPGDSGYGGSRPTYSIASASVHGDDAVLDSQIGRVMGRCQIDTDAASFEPRQHPQTGNKFRCEDCNTFLKSQGELKKHRQRHLKPHLCPYHGCPKAQRGFSTSNDLVRHKRSVHGEHGLPGRSFICHHCRPGEKPPKVWPRADNFRSHLLRAHQRTLKFDHDHSEYLYQPPARKNDLEGVGTSVGFIDPQIRPMCLQESPVLSEQDATMGSQFREDQFARNHGPLPTQMGINPALFQRSPAEVGQRRPTPTSAASDEDRYIHPGALRESVREPSEEYGMQHEPEYAVDAQGYSHVQLPDDDGGDDDDAGRCLSASSPGHGELSGDPTTKTNRESWKPDGSGPSESTQPGLDDLSADMANLQQPQRRPDDSPILDLIRDPPPGMSSKPSEIVNYLKTFPKELLQTALGGEGQDTEGGNQVDDEDGPRAHFDCEEPHCGKAFVRQCELKKHKKRHDKPYGCTFKSCSKRFGSKNDWKRHESSQHFQLETWNCDEPDCKKTCQRRESFKNHLQKDHGMSDVDIIDDKLEACRLGRHCDPRFWCGFCVRIIEIDVNERGGNSWTKRCDHIDNHLFGKDGLQSKFIHEWKHQDDEQEAPASTGAWVPPTRAPLSEVESNDRKRRSSTDANPRPRKRATQTQTYMWTCCMCSTTMNLKTSSCCFECHHQRCRPNCTVEYVSTIDDEEEETDRTRPAGDSRLEEAEYGV
ncbi:Sex-determining transformer protein 1 [Tolypocladium paradoxum]|uniref:Sex-determining transformer protein 1 n=1 Tax=Tolypocladium paradoxum TaxID=94208 RepID=A0A2S4L9P7_9HYPO|nr:Sex-determining transformer protein 1 [Tolypocladium paradoxum]